MMNLQNKIDSIMQYEGYAAIVCGAAIVIFCIMAITSKKKADTKGGYSLLILFAVSFVVMFAVCNLGGDAI